MAYPKTYKTDKGVFEIPEKEVSSFLKDFPNAMEVVSYKMGKDTFDIPVQETEVFLKENPQAVPLKKKEPSGNGLQEPSDGGLGGTTPKTETFPTIEMYQTPTGDLTEDPFAQVKKSKELLGKTKVVSKGGIGGMGMGTTGTEIVPDEEATKEANKIQEELKRTGYKEDFFAGISDLPEDVYNNPTTSKETLSVLYKNNPVKFTQLTNEAKNKYAIRDAAAKKAYDEAQGDDKQKTEYASRVGILKGNEYSGDEIAPPENMQQFYDIVRQKQQLIDQNIDSPEEKKKAHERLRQTYAQAINPTSLDFREEYENSGLADKLDVTQYAGLKTYELFEPEKAKVLRSMVEANITPQWNVNVQVTPEEQVRSIVTDSAMAEKMGGVISELTTNQRIAKEEALRELSLVGATNEYDSIVSEQNDLKNKYKEAQTDEEKAIIYSKMLLNEQRANDLQKTEAKNDERYPITAKLKMDNLVKEIVQDRGIGVGGWMYNKYAHGVGSGVDAVENLVTSIFGSEKEKTDLRMKRIGEGKQFEASIYLPESERSVNSPVIIQASDELKKKAKEILNGRSLSELSPDEKDKLSQLVASNQDQIKTITNPEAGKSKNFWSKATGMTIAGFTADMGSFLTKMGLMQGVGMGAKAAEATTLFMDGYEPAFNKKLAEGASVEAANEYGILHGAILSLMSKFGSKYETIKNVVKGGSSPISKYIAGLSEESWNKLAAESKPLLSKVGAATKNVVKEQGKMIGTFGVAAPVASALADNLFYDEGRSVREIADEALLSAKEMAIGGIGFGLFGLAKGVMKTKATPVEKAALIEMADYPGLGKMRIDEAVKNREISKEEGERKKGIIDNVSRLVEQVPEVNDKGKPLNDQQKANYLFNLAVKESQKEKAKTLPEKQAEEAKQKALVADKENQIELEALTEKQLNDRKDKLEKAISKLDEKGKPELSDKEMADAKAELQAVENIIKSKGDTSKTERGEQTKKADIERRRQEELNNVGVKQKERAFSQLRDEKDEDGKVTKVRTPEEKLNAVNLIERNVAEGSILTKEEQEELQKTKDELASQGYEVPKILGQKYHEGMKVLVTNSIPDKTLAEGEEVITKVLNPQINKDGKMVQTAQIEVTVGTKKGGLTREQWLEEQKKKETRTDKINAKYDAELAELENPTPSKAAEQPTVDNTLTQEAKDLLKSIGEGSKPTFITKNLERIAKENGIEVTDKMSADDVINALKEKQKQQSEQVGSVVDVKDGFKQAGEKARGTKDATHIGRWMLDNSQKGDVVRFGDGGYEVTEVNTRKDGTKEIVLTPFEFNEDGTKDYNNTGIKIITEQSIKNGSNLFENAYTNSKGERVVEQSTYERGEQVGSVVGKTETQTKPIEGEPITEPVEDWSRDVESTAKALSENIKQEPDVIKDGDDLILRHGTPHDFSKFQLEKIGTGEGKQAFGYGLYFTDGSKIAEQYAKKLSEDKTGLVYEVKIKDGAKKEWVEWREPLEQDVENKLYDSLTDSERKQYEDYLDKSSWDNDHVGKFDELKRDEYGLETYDKPSAVGLIYRDLKDAFGQEKATEIFKRAGVDGIKYRSNAGRGDNFNYVVFDPNSIEIIKKEKPLLSGNPQKISEAYHKAKADGSNPELVKAVESLLSKEQTPPALRAVESTAKALGDNKHEIKNKRTSDEKYVRYNPDDVLPLLKEAKISPADRVEAENFANQRYANDASIEEYKYIPIDNLMVSEKIESKDRKSIDNIKEKIKNGEDLPAIVVDFNSVIKNGNEYKFPIADGHHRYIAYKELGYKEVPAAIVTSREDYQNTTNDKDLKTLFNNDLAISEAYHKAKADGSNPELVKAVEDLLGKPKTQTSEQPTKPVTKPIPEVTETTKEQGVKEAVPEGTTETGRTEPEGTAAVLEGGKGMNNPPKPPTDKVGNEESGKLNDKGVLNHLVSAKNIPEESRKGFEEKGLKYNTASQKEAEDVAKSVIDQYGIDDAVLLAEAQKFDGDVNSLIYAESLNRLAKLEENAKTPQEKYDLAKKFAEVGIKYDEAGRKGGRFSSAINYFYKKSPLGIQMIENAKRKQAFEEWSKPKDKSWKEFFDEMMKEPEFEQTVKEYSKEELKKERAEARASRIKKVDEFFDKAKDEFKGGAAYLAIIPPKVITTALEGMRQAYHAGEKIAEIIEKAIDYISEQIGNNNWDKEKFRKEWSEKLKDKETKKPLTDEEIKAKILDKFRKKLKGLTDKEKEEVVRKSFQKIVESGGLDYADFKKIIADITGRGELTEAETARLKELVKETNLVDEAGERARVERTQEARKAYFDAQTKAAKASKELNELLYNRPNIIKRLTSIMQLNTLGIPALVNNPIYNIWNQTTLRLPVGIVKTIIDQAIKYGSGGKIAPETNILSKAAQAEFFSKLGLGTKESFQQFFTGLNRADYVAKEIQGQQIRPATAIRDLWAFFRGKKNLDTQQQVDKALQATVGIPAEIVARTLNLGDKPQRFAAEGAQAAAFAKALGLKDIDYDLFIDFPREEAYRAYKQKGLSDAEAGKKADYIKDIIIKEGQRSTFQQDNMLNDVINRAFGGEQSGLGSLAKSITISPYIKIPSNAYWSYYNLVNPEVAFLQSIIYGAKAAAKQYGGYKKFLGDKDNTSAAKDLNEAKYWFAHGAVGMATRAVVISLVGAGAVRPSNTAEDTKKEREGEQNYEQQGTINVSKLFAAAQGKNPDDIKNGLNVQMRWFGHWGTIADAIARKNEEMTPEQRKNQAEFWDAALGGLEIDALKDLNQGVFGNTSSLLTAIERKDFQNYGVNLINMFTNVVQPAALAQVEKAAMPYYTKQKADTFLGELNNTMLTRSKLYRDLTNQYPPSKIGIWGDKLEKKDNFGMRLFGISRSNPDNFAQPIYEDYKRTNNTKFLPPSVRPIIEKNGVEIKLPTQDAARLEELVGQQRKNLISPYINDMATFEGSNKVYSKLSDSEKEDKLRILYEEGYNNGKELFLKEHPEYNIPDKTRQEKIEDKKESRANKMFRKALQKR